MNIQIYGKTKCFDTKKAERYFKERGIKFQFIELDKMGFSPREYETVSRCVGGFKNLIDDKSKEYEKSFMAYLAYDEEKEQKLLDNPKLFKTPIVRNGKFATVGFKKEVWDLWE